jgi:hypothetical protein
VFVFESCVFENVYIRVGHEKKNSYEEQKNVAPMSTNHEASYCVEKKNHLHFPPEVTILTCPNRKPHLLIAGVFSAVFYFASI